MKKTSISGLIIFFLIFFLLTLPVFGREINGDLITINTGQSQEIKEVIIEGNVSIVDDDLQFKGDYACYNMEKEELAMEGNIEVINSDYNLYGDQLQGNLEQEKFLLSGNTELKGSGLLLEAENINFDNREGIIVLTGAPSFTYRNLTASADKITYYIEGEKAILEGNVEGKRNGQKFKAANLTVSMLEEEIKLSGKAQLIFSDEGDK